MDTVIDGHGWLLGNLSSLIATLKNIHILLNFNSMTIIMKPPLQLPAVPHALIAE